MPAEAMMERRSLVVLVINVCWYISSYVDLNDAAIPGADENERCGETH